ncbi:OmpA family protein [Aureisphaera galaxeae]|uniref:OmpA family protein n=1 Tax=Aureisphaera galaxeae TaxID=1538023 RepID=UPI00235012B3|nr:OmpA family protein [Aureisphaera galaxeae]MDC8004219.1 OmpA family protein [Aureisphaera galaxeae]
MKQIASISLALVLALGLTGCDATRNANNKQKGAVIGAAGGAVLGAILGNNIGKGGNGEIGAVIGGVVGGAAGVLIGAKMDKNAQKIEEEVPGAKVERVDDGIIVTFDGENNGVYFDTNKYNINADSKATLDKLAGVLVEFRDTDVLVVGHTDSTGSDEYNMTLSKNRAQSVTNYFTGSKGLSPGRFNTNWFGETSPIASNDTPEGRAQNRRVNIVIVPNEKMKQEAEKEAGGGN